MRSFEYFTPTRVVFGKDTHLKIATLLKEQNCKKVLIHYGGHSAVKSGLINEIRSVLDEAGIAYVTLGGVVPNPRLSKVREGIELCRRENVDFLLAVGGGSVIDSCKAIGYGLANPETDVWNFFLRTETPKACLPVGVILTIAASGSEMSNSCVITNEEGWLKRSTARNDLCRPRFAILTTAYIHLTSVSDRKRLCGYPDAYHGTVFCKYRNYGNYRQHQRISDADGNLQFPYLAERAG